MSEISELEGRITAALDRIRQGGEGMDASASGGPSDELAGQLAEERTANEQLRARVDGLKDRLDGQLQTLQTSTSGLEESLSTLSEESARLKDVNRRLMQNNAALREANETGLGDAHLINKSLMSEVESLRAARAVETAEIEALLARFAHALEMGQNGKDAGDA